MNRRAAYVLCCILALPVMPAYAAVDCLPPDAVPALFRSARTIILGELHGTTQSPAFAAALACTLTQLGSPVLLGLELPTNEQAAIATYVAGGSEQAFRAAAQSSPFWVREKHDGRTSTAMLDLLAEIRHLKAHGANVEVVAFDPEPPQYRPGDTPDRLMAENLRVARASQPDARLLVLVGSYHAKRSSALTPDTLVDALGSDSVVALRMQHSGGTAWICRGKTVATLTCGSVAVDRPAGAIASRPPISLLPTAEAGFDGIYYVGRIVASPPAFRKGDR